MAGTINQVLDRIEQAAKERGKPMRFRLAAQLYDYTALPYAHYVSVTGEHVGVEAGTRGEVEGWLMGLRAFTKAMQEMGPEAVIARLGQVG